MADPMIQRIDKLKEKIATAKSKRDMLTGRLDEIKARLKKDHGVSTIEEGEKLLAELQDESDIATKRLEKLIKKVEDELGE